LESNKGEAARSSWYRRKQRVIQKRNAEGSKFKLAELKRHLHTHHPNCPEHVRHELYRLVRERRWDVPIGQAIGITMQNLVRHQLTNYERLYDAGGMTKERARLTVKARVNEIIAGWSLPPSASASEDDAEPGHSSVAL
jgi:hypothetical protein